MSTVFILENANSKINHTLYFYAWFILSVCLLVFIVACTWVSWGPSAHLGLCFLWRLLIWQRSPCSREPSSHALRQKEREQRACQCKLSSALAPEPRLEMISLCLTWLNGGHDETDGGGWRRVMIGAVLVSSVVQAVARCWRNRLWDQIQVMYKPLEFGTDVTWSPIYFGKIVY